MECSGRDWRIVGTKVAPLLGKEIQVDDLAEDDVRPNSESARIDVKMAMYMTRMAFKQAAEVFHLSCSCLVTHDHAGLAVGWRRKSRYRLGVVILSLEEFLSRFLTARTADP